MKNSFRDWLDSKGIKYEIPEDCQECVAVDDYELRNYEGEILKLFPSFEFIWNVIPKHHEDN